jgi:hypothetical protein
VTNNCFALWRYPGGTGTVTGDSCYVKNNILINTRSGGNTSTFFCSIANQGTYTSKFVSNYNFLMNNASAASGRNDLGIWGGTVYSTFASYQTASSQDANSFNATYNATTTFSSGNLNPANLFTTPSIADMHIAYTNGTTAYQFVANRATPLGSITTDYDYQTRSLTTPDIGADEFDICSQIAITSQPVAQVICSGSNAVFAVKNTGGTPYTYQWQISTNRGSSWSPLTISTPYSTDAAGDTLYITGAASSLDSNLYRVEVSNSCGDSISAGVLLNVMSGSTNAYLATTSDSLLVETCPDGSWTYYSLFSDPTKWLFAINENGNTFAATPKLTMHFTNPTAYDSVANAPTQSALYTMNRYWNVSLNSGVIDSNVGKVSVRFFYNPTDTLTMTNAAKAWALAHPSTISGYTTSTYPVEWFKTVHTTYNPTNNTASAVPTAYTFSPSSYTYGVLNGINYVELDNIVSFSGGTAAIRVAPTSGPSIALPVTLLYLKATAINNQYIRLDWATASEINNSGFQIERSIDGISFDSIGWAQGHGNSIVVNDYQYPDMTAQPDIVYYYRLKQIDVDGNFTYSYVVSSTIFKSGVIVSELIPNPASTSAMISLYSSEEQAANVQIYNATGQMVRSMEQNIYSGANFIELNVSDLASGLYLVDLHIADQNIIRKLVVR